MAAKKQILFYIMKSVLGIRLEAFIQPSVLLSNPVKRLVLQHLTETILFFSLFNK